MAHGFLQSFDPYLEVFSAGTKPAGKVNPLAVKAMLEKGIDISRHTPHGVEEYLSEPWHYVITVCGGANESCPAFVGNVKHCIHIGFDDPSEAVGSEEYVMSEFRRVRDEIKGRFEQFYKENLE